MNNRITSWRGAMAMLAALGAAGLAGCGSVAGMPGTAEPPTMPAQIQAQPPALAAAWTLDDQHGQAARESVTGRADPVHYVFNQARYKPASGPLWHSACIRGGCLLFDGYSTDVTAPGLPAAALRQGLTVSAWVAPHAYEWGDGGQYSAIASQFDQQAKQGFSFGVYRFGTWGIKLGLGSAVHDVRVRERKLPKDAWSHVAASYDAQAGRVRLYLNGELAADAAVPAQGGFALPAAPLTLGRHSQPTVLAGVFQLNTFLGLLDEVRIHAGALPGEGIARMVTDDLAAHGGKAPVLAEADVKVPASEFDGDRHRPQFHALPDSGWMNEPHAPFYYRGQYHLFFQKNPFGPFWHQIHWGHWISPDMVHWREAPIALAPDDDSLAPDGIWSGSASYTADGLPALFFTAGNDSLALKERTGMALPQDPADPDLLRWTKVPQPVTLQGPDAGRQGDFRDPFVFRHGDRWFQLVGSVAPGRSGTALVYESPDLRSWTYRGPLFSLDAARYPDFVRTFELPVLLPLGKGKDGRERHIFMTDVGAQAYYWTGVFDANKARFIPDSEAPRVFDLGDHHFSGPSGMVDPKTGRTIVFSIAQGERTSQAEWDSGWAHNAGLPVSMWLGGDGDVRLAPIAETASLRQQLLLDLRDAAPEQAAAALAGVGGDMLEVELQLAYGNAAGQRGLALRRAPGGAEETRVYLDPARGRFEIDRNRSTLDPEARSHGVQGDALDLQGEPLRLRVFVDRSMLEAYVNERKSLTSRAYPTRLDATGLALMAAPGDRVLSLKVWRMGAANGKPVAPAGESRNKE